MLAIILFIALLVSIVMGFEEPLIWLVSAILLVINIKLAKVQSRRRAGAVLWYLYQKHREFLEEGQSIQVDNIPIRMARFTDFIALDTELGDGNHIYMTDRRLSFFYDFMYLSVSVEVIKQSSTLTVRLSPLEYSRLERYEQAMESLNSISKRVQENNKKDYWDLD